MPTFLERYQNGQHTEVWDDLLALADQVFAEPLLTDAQAVADETMRRARHNVEVLIPRLAAAGYRFATPARERRFAKVSDMIANPKLSSFVRKQMERAVAAGTKPASVLDPAQNRAVQMNLATLREEKTALEAELERMRTMPPLENPKVFYAPEGNAHCFSILERFAKGSIPLSLRAWYNHVGFVSFRGAHEVLNPEGSAIADPFEMRAVSTVASQVATGQRGDKIVLGVSNSDWHKAEVSNEQMALSYYAITIPNASVDWPLENEFHQTSFVNYLRKVFEWAGFPGWERDPNPPREMISQLTAGLLPL